MDLSKQPLFRMMTERMAFLGQRQKVLAQNVANADTPNYQARDLKAFNFQAQVERESRRVTPSQTQSGHLPPVSAPDTFKVERVRKPYETSLSGNGVVLEEQMGKVAETQVDYQTTAQLYRKYVDMMKIALK
jgi:flagellar basal-body rod protein FlgB